MFSSPFSLYLGTGTNGQSPNDQELERTMVSSFFFFVFVLGNVINVPFSFFLATWMNGPSRTLRILNEQKVKFVLVFLFLLTFGNLINVPFSLYLGTGTNERSGFWTNEPRWVRSLYVYLWGNLINVPFSCFLATWTNGQAERPRSWTNKGMFVYLFIFYFYFQGT